MTFVAGQTLTADELNPLIPPSASLLGGTGTTFAVVNIGTGMVLSLGTLAADYHAGTLAAFATGLTLSGGTLAPNYQADTLTTIGSGVTLTSGTLTAAGTGGSVTSVVAGSGLSGGTITTSGTINADWHGGTVATLGLGVGLNSGTLSVRGQSTIAATNGTTIAIAPAGSVTNYMINGPAAGGTVTVTGSFTPGQSIVMNFSNAATATTNFIIGSGFQFSSDLPSYTSTAVNGRRDIVAAICNVGTVGDIAAINQGFTP